MRALFAALLGINGGLAWSGAAGAAENVTFGSDWKAEAEHASRSILSSRTSRWSQSPRFVLCNWRGSAIAEEE